MRRTAGVLASTAVLLLGSSCVGGLGNSLEGDTPEERAESFVSVMEARTAVSHAEADPSGPDDQDYYTVKVTLDEDAALPDVDEALDDLLDLAGDVNPEKHVSALVSLGNTTADLDQDSDEDVVARALLEIADADVPGKVSIPDDSPLHLAVDLAGGSDKVAEAAAGIAELGLDDVRQVQIDGVGAGAKFLGGVTDEKVAIWRDVVAATDEPDGYQVWDIRMERSPDVIDWQVATEYVVLRLDLDKPLPPKQLNRRRLHRMLWPLIRDLRQPTSELAPDAQLAIGIRDDVGRSTWVVHGAAAEITRSRWTT